MPYITEEFFFSKTNMNILFRLDVKCNIQSQVDSCFKKKKKIVL